MLARQPRLAFNGRRPYKSLGHFKVGHRSTDSQVRLRLKHNRKHLKRQADCNFQRRSRVPQPMKKAL
jgi:hypothetical protein